MTSVYQRAGERGVSGSRPGYGCAGADPIAQPAATFRACVAWQAR
ncbi:hypothetical protein O0235_14095 [Tepidiforma flava]|uniref:Uncharacterized protein n=1 Tax=Tepidiforma flava TaxID=3004094 RepID=A0ABY7M8C0_9CHLR|nr:hypothetical protein [Tepidiforma flava]WBL35883.1 hypothetical protein O0235_14095 [Tepidiforma flava]